MEFSEVPAQAVELAVQAAKAADLDEVGIDLAMVDHRPLLLEFNVKYGRQGPSQMGLDVVDYVAQGILAGRLPPPRE